MLDVTANNLLDESYIDHLSTLKDLGYYNPGRNVMIGLKIPLQIKK
jgi:iron complex outermembrane receptor protein